MDLSLEADGFSRVYLNCLISPTQFPCCCVLVLGFQQGSFLFTNLHINQTFKMYCVKVYINKIVS